ncbi:fibronectin type III domain-containing protein [Candidatus Daviesbacteria bacterium]|nr:fibronectin type III domain-containing protein [Candidatus Daviesbacteria bacterium]
MLTIIKFISKFKIPTLLGLSIIILGIVAGVYLNLKEQIILSRAAPNVTPQNITITNITDTSVTISWQTNSPITSFVAFGQNNPGEQTVLDDQDNNPPAGGPKPHFIHYATLKNLLPKTSYQFKVVSGKMSSNIEKFQTAQPLSAQSEFTPVIGSALDGDTPLNEGIAYLSISGAITQSSPVKEGNFLIPLSSIRKADLSDIYKSDDDSSGKITIVSEKGTADLLFKLKNNSKPLPPVKLGQNIDLTTEESLPSANPNKSELDKYDLNDDGKINAADNAIILQDFGKNLKNSKADINQDGKVNQKDLDLMAQKFKNQ